MVKKFSGHSSSGYGSHKGKRWHIGNVLLNADLLGENIPSFNLKGQTVVTTIVGGVLSLIILSLVLTYSSIKAVELFSRNNPTIVESQTDKYTTGQLKFSDIG